MYNYCTVLNCFTAGSYEITVRSFSYCTFNHLCTACSVTEQFKHDVQHVHHLNIHLLRSCTVRPSIVHSFTLQLCSTFINCSFIYCAAMQYVHQLCIHLLCSCTARSSIVHSFFAAVQHVHHLNIHLLRSCAVRLSIIVDSFIAQLCNTLINCAFIYFEVVHYVHQFIHLLRSCTARSLCVHDVQFIVQHSNLLYSIFINVHNVYLLQSTLYRLLLRIPMYCQTVNQCLS
ncbi:unnamed protein product [Owenia fusiformis]|uniref:Uncharacterized protein n=1 Tax=Owenia fusiformis TaxID=6347 RepID=A0A8J1UJ67_OWEFU|nr:unnamed protein product [Owenia fusiformis]